VDFKQAFGLAEESLIVKSLTVMSHQEGGDI
jgi:hypothetical protein